MKSPSREEREEVHYINFIKIGVRTYYAFDFEVRTGTKIFLRVPDRALDRNIGRVTLGPRDSVPPDGIASAYRKGAEVHAIANVSEENFIAVKRGPEELYHEVFWRVERERGETFAADAERVTALNAEVQQAEAARAAERQRRQEYINAHPWPNRVVLGGEFYKYLGSVRTLPLTALGPQLGTVKRAVRTNDAYPADFQWREGDAGWEPVGTPICAIKGVDSRYYVATVGFFSVSGHEFGQIFVNEKQHSDKALAALHELLLSLPEE